MRIAVLCGGTSGEHEVSVSSGWQVLQNLAPGHRVWPVLITPTGEWKIAPPDAPGHWPTREALVATFDRMAPLPALTAALRLQENIETVFVILHGPGGEDGIIQGFLETIGIPYTGSGVAGCALAMDKTRSKWAYLHHGVPTARFREVRAGEPVDAASLARELGLPLAVKAPSQGSSVGLAIVDSEAGLAAAVDRLLPLEGRLLVESFVTGRELTCGVIGAGPDGSPPRALVPTEIRPKVAAWFDYRAKYEAGGSEEITPAPLDAETTGRVQELALRCHDILGLGGMSRTDFILGPGGPVVLETNTLPGMTATSLLPQQAAAIGWDFTRLLEEILARAIRPRGALAPDAGST